MSSVEEISCDGAKPAFISSTHVKQNKESQTTMFLHTIMRVPETSHLLVHYYLIPMNKLRLSVFTQWYAILLGAAVLCKSSFHSFFHKLKNSALRRALYC